MQHNYSAEDKGALLEFIYMIKNMSGILISLERDIQPLLDEHIYDFYQSFSKQKIAEYLSAAIKKKKQTIPFIAANLGS